MRWPDGRYIQASIFFSRWLLAPFLLGLLLCLFLLMYRFFGDLFALAIVECRTPTWHDIVTGVLNLIDMALTANLILIVIFSSYENFIRRIDRRRPSRLARGPHSGRFRRAETEAARLDRRHRRGRCAGLVFRSRQNPGHPEAALGPGFPADAGFGHADPRDRRLVQRSAQKRPALRPLAAGHPGR